MFSIILLLTTRTQTKEIRYVLFSLYFTVCSQMIYTFCMFTHVMRVPIFYKGSRGEKKNSFGNINSNEMHRKRPHCATLQYISGRKSHKNEKYLNVARTLKSHLLVNLLAVTVFNFATSTV